MFERAFSVQNKIEYIIIFLDGDSGPKNWESPELKKKR